MNVQFFLQILERDKSYAVVHYRVKGLLSFRRLSPWKSFSLVVGFASDDLT